MNTTLLFDYQSKSDRQVNINPCLNQYKLSARKSLELQITLGSLADETNCFKYTLNTTESSICFNTVFQKYLNCFSKILSIGIDRNYSDITNINVRPNDYCLSDQFLNLYIDINDLLISPSKDHFLTLLEDFVSLGVTLGYSEKQIMDNFINE